MYLRVRLKHMSLETSYGLKPLSVFIKVCACGTNKVWVAVEVVAGVS